MSATAITPGSPPEVKHPISVALSDIRAGWQRRQLWWMIAYQDLIAQYRRSRIGPFWITIQMSAFVLGISVVYAGLFRQDFTTFLPYVAIGFLVWGLISTSIVDSTKAYFGQAGYIRSTSLPLSIYSYRTVASHVWTFAHNVVPVVLLLILLRVVPSPWALILTPLGLLAIVLNAFFVCLWLGPVCARYRDIAPFVASAMQLMMFITPVFWMVDSLPSRAAVIWNPFAYFLEAVRAPLLNEPVRPFVWLVIISITIVNGLLALVLFGRNRRWIAYWVG